MSAYIDSDKIVSTFVSKGQPQGNTSEHATATVAAGTTTTSTIRMHRFQKGFSPSLLVVKSADLDTGTSVTLNVGVEYDDASLTDDPDYFFAASDIAQDAGSVVWPAADGLNVEGFSAAGDGYITITPAAGTTITAGAVQTRVTFTYDDQR